MSTENIFLFLTLYKSPKKSRHSHAEQMCGDMWPIGRRVVGRAGHRWARARQLTGGLPLPRTGHLLPTAQVRRAKVLGGWRMGPDDRPLPLPFPLLSLPCPPHLSPAQGPWLPYSVGPWSPWEKGVLGTSTVSTLHPPWSRPGLSSSCPSAPCPPRLPQMCSHMGRVLLETRSQGDTPPHPTA